MKTMQKTSKIIENHRKSSKIIGQIIEKIMKIIENHPGAQGAPGAPGIPGIARERLGRPGTPPGVAGGCPGEPLRSPGVPAELPAEPGGARGRTRAPGSLFLFLRLVIGLIRKIILTGSERFPMDFDDVRI